jgi:malate synthase
MSQRLAEFGLQIDPLLHNLINTEILPGTGVDPQRFWQGFAAIVNEFAPRTRALLAKRDALQAAIDAWHRDHLGSAFDAGAYKKSATCCPKARTSASKRAMSTPRSRKSPGHSWWCR